MAPKPASATAIATAGLTKGDRNSAKAAKAERRAATKQPNSSTANSPNSPSTSKQQQQQQHQHQHQPTTTSTPTPTAEPTPSSSALPDPLQLFLHLELPSSSSSLSHSSHSSTTQIHPSILKLALKYSEFKIVGANARCIALLEALKDVIQSYTPPLNTDLTRNLPTTHLNPQINHLVRARPLSVSMGAAIRYLKYEISLIRNDMPTEEAKSLLVQKIDSFIRDRILLADKVINHYALTKIRDHGETILTYARSSVVEGVLLEAWKEGKKFNVVVVDSRPLYEGKNLLASLNAAGIPTTYILLPSLSVVLPKISLCLLGTHALLSNGSMFSRAGTAMVAMMLKERGVPVVCCCETYKFSERIMLDSIVGNEMASPLPLLQGLPSQTPNLSPLNLLYDVARPEDLTAVITEAGLIPPESVPVVLRDFKPLLQGA